MADIEAGKIDIVVVYKIDRLTRSLTDFSRLIEVFERNKVSFVAVTQQFNTTTSMGRLMLNVLLSFAQFEREVTGERIRDKIAASKAKGMWMGGPLPLGYDVENRLLVINEVEATLVKRIFKDFTRCRSTTDMVRELTADGPHHQVGAASDQADALQDDAQPHLSGRDPAQGPVLPRPAPSDHRSGSLGRRPCDPRGEQPPARLGNLDSAVNPSSLLLGLFYTQDGERFQPAFTRKANGKMYRYYVPIRKVRFGAKATGAGRLPAEAIERLVLAQVHVGAENTGGGPGSVRPRRRGETQSHRAGGGAGPATTGQRLGATLPGRAPAHRPVADRTGHPARRGDRDYLAGCGVGHPGR
jgi:site-specific DNA recombinase